MTTKRIAVLGGGLGAMGAVYALTSKPDWRDHFDITVYQLGWRLGGKGASGRGPNARVQEHGLHIWLGFYENAFRVMHTMLKELEGTPGVFKNVEDAFLPLYQIGIMERYRDDWQPWIIKFPERSGLPGQGAAHAHDSIWDMMVLSLEEVAAWVSSALESHPHEHVLKEDDGQGFVSRILHGIEHEAEAMGAAILSGLGSGFMHAAASLARSLPRDAGTHHSDHHETLLAILEHALSRLKNAIAQAVHDDPLLRHIFTIADMLTASFRGILRHRVHVDAQGLDILDGQEFQAFLIDNGASPENATTSTAAPLRDLYNLAFAFENGDPDRPNLAAGVALRGALSILFCYKQAPAQRMRAGMGDTIFTPFYKLLKARGVRFEFFHRLEAMEFEIVDDAKVVSRLNFAVQAEVKEGEEYDPFIRVKGLDCWPQAPLVDQLVRGDELRAGPNGDGVDGWDGDWRGYDLEDFWTTWKDAGTRTLELGRDFDLTILAIPPASHRFVAKSLVAAEPKWAKMVEDVVAVRTLAAQIWLKPTLDKTGWPHGETLVAAYQEPFDTWVDMSHLLPVEDWGKANGPGSISYLCGAMKGGLPPAEEIGVTEKADDEVEGLANQWLATASGTLWPEISDGPALRSDVTFVGKDNAGQGAMVGQFWRANVSPSELYVASHAGTVASRLDAAETGFGNLYFAGDWTRNGLNAGCVEAAVISGLRASNAIGGYPLLSEMVTYWSGSDKADN